MKKQNINNLLVNGKKLALLVMLAVSVGACGQTDKSVEPGSTKDSVVQNTSDEQRQKDKKTLLWFIPVILLGAAAGIGFTADGKQKHR